MLGMAYDIESDLEGACEELNGEVRSIPAQGGGEKEVCEFETYNPGYDGGWTKGSSQTWMLNDTGSKSGVLLERVPEDVDLDEDVFESTGDAFILTDRDDSTIHIEHHAEFETLVRGNEGASFLNIDNMDRWD